MEWFHAAGVVGECDGMQETVNLWMLLFNLSFYRGNLLLGLDIADIDIGFREEL